MLPPSLSADRLFLCAFSVMLAWMLASLWWVNIEFDDGYTTIVNSQYFLGISPEYFWQRGPLLAVLLMPAEALANALGLHPLDVWPHHIVTVLLHAGYLWCVWILLRRDWGSSSATLLAFLAAIPTVVFFSYAAFISQDILPGLFALSMPLLGARYMAHPERRSWWAMLMLGAVVALFKQTYALIWVVTLGATAIDAAVWRKPPGEWLPRWLSLFAAAACSGVAVWLVYALSLSSTFLDVPLLLRPWHQTLELVSYFRREGDLSSIIYQWVYLRNLNAYGMAAMACVLPALAYALRRGAPAHRVVAIAWVLLFLAMHAVAFKEVRYLLILAPMTAYLLAPFLQFLATRRRVYFSLFLCLWLVDAGFAAREALRLHHPYYRSGVSDFLAALPVAGELQAPVVIAGRLTFVSPERHAFFADRYHRVTNLIYDQIRLLYGYRDDEIMLVGDARALRPDAFKPGSWLIFSNEFGARVPPFPADNRLSLTDAFVQLIGSAATIELVPSGGGFTLADAAHGPAFLLPTHPGGAPALVSGEIGLEMMRALLGREDLPEVVRINGFRVSASCRLGGCTRYPVPAATR